MKLFKTPSLGKSLGITKAKMKVKRSAGVYKVTKHTNAAKNLKRRVKRKTSLGNALKKILR